MEASVADHALWLERHAQAGDSIMHQVEQRHRQFDATTNTIATSQTVQGDTTDAALREHVQAHDTAVTASLTKPSLP